MTTRTELFDHLEHETFDLLIVGAGITGAGAARDAALRGLKVALVDQGDIGGGTSSRSSKLIHGGLRYLATFQLGLVAESTAERWVQMTLAPHLVRPLEFLMPVYDFHKHGLSFMGLGLWLYDTMALFRVPRRHRTYRGRRALTRQPNLRTDGLRGALSYYDAATDDARLTLENALDAEALGATVATYAKVVAFRTDADGRVHGAEVQDRHGGRTVAVKAQMVLNTTGPWTDEVLGLRGPRERPLLRVTKGAHLVFTAERLPVEAAVVLVNPKDQRPLFAIPWGPHVYVGTTDIDYHGDLARPYAAEDDREQILESANTYFPEAQLGTKDIVGSWCGIRPLVAPEKGQSASKVSREHILMGGEDGLITMTGGKLTTYRLMAKWLVDRAVKFLRTGPPKRAIPRSSTRRRPLPGAVGLAEAGGLAGLREKLAARPGVSAEVAQHLVDGYGVRAEAVLAAARGSEDLAPVVPGNPVTWAELTHAVTAEHALTLEDFLGRRTQLVFRAPEASLIALDAVADRMTELLGWTPERRAAELAAYRDEVAGRLRCKG